MARDEARHEIQSLIESSDTTEARGILKFKTMFYHSSIVMRPMGYIWMCCILVLISCDGSKHGKASDGSDREKRRIELSSTEIDMAIALWWTYQDQAYVVVRPVVGKDFGSVEKGRDPSEILHSQREIFKILKTQGDAKNAESESILERWVDCQAEAAGSLAVVGGIKAEDAKRMEPIQLLDFQDKAMDLLKVELRQRGEKYWNK